MNSKSSPEEKLSHILRQAERGVSRKKLVKLFVDSFGIDRGQPFGPQIGSKLGRALTEDEDFKIQMICEEARLARNPAARPLNGLR